MTTELVILLTLFMVVVVGIFKTPAQSFEKSGPRLGLRIEKHLETGSGFASRTQESPNAIPWAIKP
ncbi:MAG: hypothetical protein V4596_05345 [Bdellovibrionota bacterium]